MQKFLNRCEQVYLYAAVISTFLLMCLTGIDAAGRYIFNIPIPGAYEVSENYLLVSAAFLGVCYAYRGGTFVRVTFLVGHCPAWLRIPVDYFSQGITLLLSGVMFVACVQQALRKFSSGITVESFALPVWPAYVIVPIGLIPMIIAMLLDVPRIKTGESCLFKDETHIT
jgi:TRAP-type C4-dicarboxylate transport system permease small subunit